MLMYHTLLGDAYTTEELYKLGSVATALKGQEGQQLYLKFMETSNSGVAVRTFSLMSMAWLLTRAKCRVPSYLL